MTREDFEECPYPTDDKLVKISLTKPTPAHENYDVGDIIKVIYIPKPHKVLILEKITCDDFCQFIVLWSRDCGVRINKSKFSDKCNCLK